jgi:hypothetical protein
MAITTKITKADVAASVSVSIRVSESNRPVEFRNSAMIEVPNMDNAVDPSLPFLTYRAIDSACISGAIYARRKLGLSGLAVELLSFSWTGKVENAEPFAIAIMIAVCKWFSKTVAFSEGEQNGWCEDAAR